MPVFAVLGWGEGGISRVSYPCYTSLEPFTYRPGIGSGVVRACYGEGECAYTVLNENQTNRFVRYYVIRAGTYKKCFDNKICQCRKRERETKTEKKPQSILYPPAHYSNRLRRRVNKHKGRARFASWLIQCG